MLPTMGKIGVLLSRPKICRRITSVLIKKVPRVVIDFQPQRFLEPETAVIHTLKKVSPTSRAKTSSVRATYAVVQRGLSKIEHIEYDSDGISLLVQRRDPSLLIDPPGN
jgi:hypothetical protein